MISNKFDLSNQFVTFDKNRDISLFRSLNFNRTNEEASVTIFDNAKRILNDDTKKFLINSGNKTPEITSIKEPDINNKEISVNEYGKAWLRRWIALYVMTILKPKEWSMKSVNKPKLRKLISQSSNIVPGYLKILRYADLSGPGGDLRAVKLSYADLQHVNLQNTDLSGANMHNTKLDGAKLEGSTLNGANLSGATLIGAFLDRSKLVGTILFRANLSNSHLIEAHLNGAHLNNAILDDAEMRDANLSCATIYHASFQRTHLYETDFSFSNIPKCDFSDAIMFNAYLYGSNKVETYLSPDQLEMINNEPRSKGVVKY